jgi:TolA-binding protein
MKTNWETGTDMTGYVFGLVMAIVLFAGVTPGWSQQQYLYAPRPVAAEEKVRKEDGILVQEVPVKKGDTLSRISRRFSGHGSYFPQILLFNDIKNPDRIYTGTTLRIPVSRSGLTGQAAPSPVQGKKHGVPSAGPVPGSTAAELNQGTAVKEKKRIQKRTSAASEQRQFERAIKAYRQGDYRRALELFDRFLADYPASALAADASLYKAECYLKQSNQ